MYRSAVVVSQLGQGVSAGAFACLTDTVCIGFGLDGGVESDTVFFIGE